MTETHGGSLLWELEAEYAWRIPQENKVHLEDLEVVFYDNEGKEASRLTARRGSVDEQTGILTTQYRVKLISVDGDTLTTEELSYDKNNDLVSGPGFVRLAKPDRVLTGFDFRSTPDLSDYEVREDVTITIIDRGENIETGP
jgi:LPS export ABC transporter protein LptC